MPANVPGGYEIRPCTPSGSMLVIHPGTLRQPSGARVVEDAAPYRRGRIPYPPAEVSVAAGFPLLRSAQGRQNFTRIFAKPLDVDPQSCYYDSTSFAGLFFMPFFKGACKREGGLLTDNGGAEQ